MVSGGRVGWVGGLVKAGGGAWCGTNIPHLHPTSGQGIPDFRSKIGASTDVWRNSRQYGRGLIMYGELGASGVGWGAYISRWERVVSC